MLVDALEYSVDWNMTSYDYLVGYLYDTSSE